MDDHLLGQRIRRLREQKRLTQADLAEALKVSAKTVSNWESGRNIPRASLGAINEFFGTDIQGAEVTAIDPIVLALRQSSLHEWRQDAVLSFYKRQLHEQRGEASETEMEEAARIGTEMARAANRGKSQGRARRKQQDLESEAGGA